MKHAGAVILFALVPFLSGCSKPEPDEYVGRAAVAINEKNFNLAIEEYEKLMADHPQSPHAEEGMFVVARIQADELKDYHKAIASYKKYLDRYPNGKKAPMALFLSAYLYHNELNDIDNAKRLYEQFLEQYPDDEMALSAKFELRNLGKKPEEILPPELQAPPQTAEKSKPSKGKKN